MGKQAGKAWEAIDDFALPAIGFALGGPAGAALGGAAAGAIGGGRPKLKKIALGAASGAVSGGLGGGAGAGGGLASLTKEAVAGGGVKSLASGGFKAGLKKIGGTALNNLDLILGGAQLAAGQDQQRKADRYGQKMLAQIEQDYAARAPLRSLGMAQVLDTQRPDMGALYTARRFNPFG